MKKYRKYLDEIKNCKTLKELEDLREQLYYGGGLNGLDAEQSFLLGEYLGEKRHELLG